MLISGKQDLPRLSIVTRRFSLAASWMPFPSNLASHFNVALLYNPASALEFSLQLLRVTPNSQRCSTKQHYVVLALLRNDLPGGCPSFWPRPAPIQHRLSLSLGGVLIICSLFHPSETKSGVSTLPSGVLVLTRR
jgi:hypothetical protein